MADFIAQNSPGEAQLSSTINPVFRVCVVICVVLTRTFVGRLRTLIISTSLLGLPTRRLHLVLS